MYHKKPIAPLIMRYCLVSACMALCAFFVYFPLTDTDIFWHLAAGREMVLHKQWLFTDPFSFTLQSPQWIDLHWLFQLITYGIYCLGAEKALIVFKLIVVALVAGILCSIHRTRHYAAITAFSTALLLYEARYLICLRPVLITMLCMALYVYLFENTRDKENKKALWLCIPLQIIWTNSQGLYMIGLFMIGAYWAEAVIDFFRKKSPRPDFITVLFASAILSCLINPYGLRGVALPFTFFRRISPDASNIFSMNIAENIPLFSLTGYEAIYRVTVIITALAALALFALNRKDLRPAHIALFLGFSYLAFSAERNVLLYIIIIIPIIGYHATRCGIIDACRAMQRTLQRPLKYALYAGALLMLLSATVQHAWVVAIYPAHRMLSPFRFPEKITEYLKRNPIEGRMFNDIRYGGYLLWNFYPSKQVFVDGRLILRSEHFFAEYLRLCDTPELFPQVVRQFNITHAILPSAIFTLYHKLIRWLYESNQWRLEYTDGESMLFVRSDSAKKPSVDLSDQTVVDAVLDSIRVQWQNAPYVRREAMGYFSEMLGYLGLVNSAEMVKIRMHQTSEE